MQTDANVCFLLGQLTIRSQLLTEGKETIWQGFHEHFLSVRDMFKPNLLEIILTWWCVAGNHWASSWWKIYCSVFQFSSVQLHSCVWLCDPMNHSTPGLPVHHQLSESTQTHVHWVGDAIQPSHPLSSPSPPALNLAQHQGLFKWVSSSHQVAKVLEFQLQHWSFQWTPRTDLL